jgi:hypothetical protein
MSNRSPVPSVVIDPEHQSFLDDLYKRRVAAVSRVASTASASELATAFNALITAMQTSGAMEST